MYIQIITYIGKETGVIYLLEELEKQQNDSEEPLLGCLSRIVFV